MKKIIFLFMIFQSMLQAYYYGPVLFPKNPDFHFGITTSYNTSSIEVITSSTDYLIDGDINLIYNDDMLLGFDIGLKNDLLKTYISFDTSTDLDYYRILFNYDVYLGPVNNNAKWLIGFSFGAETGNYEILNSHLDYKNSLVGIKWGINVRGKHHSSYEFVISYLYGINYYSESNEFSNGYDRLSFDTIDSNTFNFKIKYNF